MDNSLLINTYIRTILCSDVDIKALLSDNNLNNTIKIYPCDARAGTSFPFVVVHRDSITPEYTKDGCYENEVFVTIFVVDSDYDKCVTLANKIRNKLDLCRYSTNDVYIDNIQLSNATEYIMENSFVQELHFKVNIAN